MQRKTCLFPLTQHRFGARIATMMFVILLIGTGAKGQILRKLHAFTAVPLTGANPQAGLVQAKDGAFYGTTNQGGLNNVGTLFKIDSSGNLTTLYNFNRNNGGYPRSELLQGKDGFLYGTTYAGGKFQGGTLFRFDTTTGKLTFIYNFAGTDGANPQSGLMQAKDGFFYGMTAQGGTNGLGTVFRFNTTTGKLTSLWSFSGSDGSSPQATLIQAKDGFLYGTTYQGGTSKVGTVFKLDPSSGLLTVLHSFTGTGPDGANPAAGLMQAKDGFLYGTTYQGGAHSAGTIYKVDASGNLSTVRSMATPGTTEGGNPTGVLALAADGFLYGTTYTGGVNYSGTVFRLDTVSATVTTLVSLDNIYCQGNLLQAKDGLFYATSIAGGLNKHGAIFKVDTAGNVTVLNSFDNSTADGAEPQASLVQGTNGLYYGTTTGGGINNQGVVFSIDANGTQSVLHQFTGIEGSYPYATLIQGSDGLLYGATLGGGAENQGTIFSLDPGTKKLVTLYSFHSVSTTGAHPWGGMVQGKDGFLYGTTLNGGTANDGTLFRVDTAGKSLTTLYNFTGADGINPQASLIQGKDGLLYGTTYQGGTAGNGTLFAFNLTTSKLTTLHSFTGTGTDGSNPLGTLVQGTDGFLYGTTAYGGANRSGTVYRSDVAGTSFTTLVSFNFTNGYNPTPGVTQGRDGLLYGMTYEGGDNNRGTLYRVDPVSQQLTTIYSFSGPDGSYPTGGLIQGSDGRLYGTTEYLGGSTDGNADGLVFSLDLQTLNATDVTSSIKVTRSSLTVDPVTQLNIGTLTITNSGKTDLVGPLTFVLNNLSTSGSLLANAAGAIGSSLITPYLVDTNTLAAGASVTLPVQFYIPPFRTLNYTVAAYAGSLDTPTPRLTNFTLSPSTVVGGTTETATLTLSSAAATGGAVVTLTNDNTTVTVPASVTIPAGSASIAFALPCALVTSTATAHITASYAGVVIPVTLTIVPATLTRISLNPSVVVGGYGTSATVRLNGPAPTGGAQIALTSNPALIGPASVTIPAGKTSAYVYLFTPTVTVTTPVQITGSYAGATVTATLTVTPPALSSFSLSPTSVAGGLTSTVTVTLNGPAPSGGSVVALTSDNTAVPVPASVTVPQGATGISFVITTVPVTATTKATLTATTGTTTRTATLTVLKTVPASIALSPTSVTGGATSTATISLNGPAPTGGAIVQLQSSNAAVIVPSSVTIPAGYQKFQVTLFTMPVSTLTPATITVTYAGFPTAAALVVRPPVLTSISLSKNSVKGGTSVTGTVSLTGIAFTDTIVTLNSANPNASVPATLTIPAGALSATFTITTSTPTTASVTGAITATAGTTTVTTNLTVTQ